MQKQNDQLRDFTLLPVPTVLLDELDIDAFSTIHLPHLAPPAGADRG